MIAIFAYNKLRLPIKQQTQIKREEEMRIMQDTQNTTKRFVSGLLAMCLVGSISVYPATANAEPATEHMHSLACYENYHLTCTDEHEHSETCYETSGNLVCGLNEGQKHVHNENGYNCKLVDRIVTCGIEEHIHNDECYVEEERPFGKVELPETGFLEENDYSDTLEESNSDKANEDLPPATFKVLNCNAEEHTHTNKCYTEVWECREESANQFVASNEKQKAELPKANSFDQDITENNARANQAELPNIILFNQGATDSGLESNADTSINDTDGSIIEEGGEETGGEVEGGEVEGGDSSEEDEPGIDRTFTYDNKMFHFVFNVSGCVYKGECTEDLSNVDFDKAEFKVKMISADQTEYQEFIDYINENGSISDLPLFQIMDYSLVYQGMKLV